MGAVLAVAGLGWRQLRRDPVGLAFTFLAPVAVAWVMVGIYRTQDLGDGYRVGVVADPGALGDHVVERLRANPVLDVEPYDDRAAAERAVRRRDIAAVVVVPVGGTNPAGSVGTVTDVTTVELVGPPDVELPGGVRAAVEASVAETAAALQLGQALRPEADAGGQLAAGWQALDRAGGGGHAEAVALDGAAWSPVPVAVIGTLVLFVVMNTMGASSLLAGLREQGVLARLRATRASPAALGLGLGLGLASYALAVAVLMLATGSVAFGVGWASWPAMAAVVVVLALTAGALGLVTGTLLPSVESGTTIAGPAGFVLGMLGGCLWPLDIVGPALRRLGHLTPHAWAVEALRATGIDGDGLGDVAGPLAALALFAVVLLLVGARRLTRIAAAP